MALIYLVRHAQASFGTDDYDRLSELGHQQARWLGEYFNERDLRFARVMHGTLRRQRETAENILAVTGQRVTPIVQGGLDEYPGDAVYRAHAGGDAAHAQRGDYNDYWRTFRAAMTAWTEDRLSPVPETWAQFGARMQTALAQSVAGLGREDKVLVVSSGGAIGRAVADLLGAPAPTAIELNLQFRNSGFSELIAGGGRLRLLSHNNIPHLDRDDRQQSITFA